MSDVVGSYTKGSTNPTFPTDSGGRFSGGLPGLAGADEVELRWSNSDGDAFTIRRAATAAEVQVGSPKAWLWGAPRATVTARLLARDGDVRGTATVTIPGGQSSAQATFRRNGSAVKVRPGDRVRIGTQTGLKVRTPDLEAATLSLVATCFREPGLARRDGVRGRRVLVPGRWHDRRHGARERFLGRSLEQRHQGQAVVRERQRLGAGHGHHRPLRR